MLEQRVQGKGRSLCTLDRIVMPLEDAPTTALAEKNEFVRGILHCSRREGAQLELCSIHQHCGKQLQI